MQTQGLSGITLRTLKQRLDEAALPYAEVSLQDGLSIVIWQRGGRIFGPFKGEDTPTIGFINQAFKDPGEFAELLAANQWNVGGTRTWISPELQFHISNRFDFDGSYSLPSELDPGNYTLTQISSQEWQLSQQVIMDTRILASGEKHLSIYQSVRSIQDPLRKLPGYDQLRPSYLFGGFEQAFTLVDDQPNNISSAIWTLMQLNPGGDLYIPTTTPAMFEFYRDPVAEPYHTVYPRHARVKLTGNRQFKLAYYSACLTGRLGYFRQIDSETAWLVVRNFFNNPSAEYTEEPPLAPGRNGQSIYVYNDDGALGGFGELECQGQCVGGISGLTTISEQMQVWCYTGHPQTLRKVAEILLGVQPE
jgi:hypothetical protein